MDFIANVKNETSNLNDYANGNLHYFGALIRHNPAYRQLCRLLSDAGHLGVQPDFSANGV